MTTTPASSSSSEGQSPKRYVVAKASDLAEGERMIVEVGRRKVGIFRIAGSVYALLHRCPHLGGPLCDGDIVGLYSSSGPGDIQYDPSRKFLMCPWHGWEFDITTGESWWDPQRTRARRLSVEITPGRELAMPDEQDPAERVPGPFVAETYEVEIEDEYIVVSLRSANPHRPHSSSGRGLDKTAERTARGEETRR